MKYINIMVVVKPGRERIKYIKYLYEWQKNLI